MILPRRKRRLIERLAQPLDEVRALLFDDPMTGLLVVDRDGRILLGNPFVAGMVGQAVEETVLESLFAPSDWPIVQTALAATARGDRLSAPIRARVAGRREHAVGVSVSPVQEADGTCSGLIVRLADIDAEQRLEARLAHSQKLHAVGQLAGGIAHDFNNLLTVIIGTADSILGRSEVDAETVDDLRQVRLAAERGAALVRQLLAFGRRQPLQPRVIAVNAAITDLAGLLRRLLGERVRLDLVLEEPGRLIRIDPIQLDQVLINLGTNARSAMPDGGTLTLRSGHRTLYKPETHGSEAIPPGRFVVIEIEDTGTGIPADILPRIFEPFFTTRREAGGTGLGLSTVLGIIRQSDGFVTVDSTVGKGTLVRLYLPRYEGVPGGIPRAEATMVPAALAEEPRPPGRLMLVEDDNAVRRFAERGLQRAGWVVAAADSAESALESLAADSRGIDLLVSDVVMPGMEGPALIAEVRKKWPDLPAILVSGYAESALKGVLQGERVVFLPKPYSLADLLRAVATVHK
jgi:two-component system cell cycle sensor histidine kinase/response regulator CckA